ncbi:MAG: hypothetical protein V4735_02785 [Pseudomonadota bacterium]
MKKLPPPADTDALLRDVMADIEALIEAIAGEQPDCDLMLAELLEGETEVVRVAIIKKLRAMLQARAQEKEKELDKFLAAEQRQKVERQRSNFRQWLSWMMSEETIRKMREAFLAMPMLERAVRGIGRDMATRGMNDIQPANKNELGGLANNAPHVQPGRDKGKGSGRE